MLKFFALFIVIIFPLQAFAIPNFKLQPDASAQTILKANQIDGDQNTNVLTAHGDVEVLRGSSSLKSDELIYDRDNKLLKINGNIKVKNLEIGNLKTKKLEIKEDFSAGKFFDSKIIFKDGSYLTSPEIERVNPKVTILKKSLFSFCPNPEIEANNDLAGEKLDLMSIKSKQTTIDKENEVMKMKSATVRFFNVPFIYTPYFRSSLASKERSTGFLSPSYVKSTNLGNGLKTPFYINIAPNMEMLITPYIGISNNQIILNNQFNHLASYGEYKINFEIANNKLNIPQNTVVSKQTDAQYRWKISNSKGIFDFTKNTGLDFSIDTVGDKNYLRDYYNNYTNYTLSKVNVDYIYKRSYHSIKTIRIQELEAVNDRAAPLVLPMIDSHIETVPLSFKEKFALTSNATVITRQDGLQYRRTSFTPEVNVPYNFRGNLFNIIAKVQGDFYSLDNNFQYTQRNNDFNKTQTNLKPEASISWRLPLINKTKSNTFVIEPMVNIVTSSYRTNFYKLPNEDSNNSELTVGNLFVNDRISGFDRNESGQRISYGAKTSFFNKYGQFGLTLGQSYKRTSGTQDVIIRGFNDNNKSNIVGQMMYQSIKYFSFIYNFQLNESSYRNDINQVTTAVNFDKVYGSLNYLLLRKTAQNLQEMEQLSLSAGMKVTKMWKVDIIGTRDIVNKRTISRGITIYRDGCCTIFGFSASETNPGSLLKPQRTFNLNFAFKNL